MKNNYSFIFLSIIFVFTLAVSTLFAASARPRLNSDLSADIIFYISDFQGKYIRHF
jgi:hypothetical protein